MKVTVDSNTFQIGFKYADYKFSYFLKEKNIML